MSSHDDLAARIRDAVNEASCGSVQRWIGLDEIERRLGLVAADNCEDAVRQAVAAGWLEADPAGPVLCVRITFPGITACGQATR
jgi:hypothetical protein